MGAAAELHRVAVAHVHHTDDVAVLLAKQRHGAQAPGLGNGHFLHVHGEALQHRLVDHALHRGDLLGLHGGEVGEVKAQPVGLNQRSGLVHMVAQHASQRLVQQVRGAVGAHDGAAPHGIHAGVHCVAHRKVPGDHHAGVQHLAGLVFLHVPDLKNRVLEDQQAVIGALAAHLGIEGRLVQHDAGLHTRADALAQLVLGHDSQDPAVIVQMIVTGEGGGGVIQPQIQAGPGRLVGGAGGAGTLALFFHQALEGLLVHAQARLGGHLLCQIQGEAVGIVEFEGVSAGEHGLVVLPVLGEHAREDAQAALDGAGKVLLLGADDAGDVLLPLGKLGIGAAVLVDDRGADLVEEGLMHAQQSSVTGRPAQQTAQHIAASLVGGQHAVADHEGGGTDVVGDDAQRDVLFVGLAVVGAGNLGHLVGDVHDRVHVKKGVHVLAHHRQTLQTHAGVDVLLAEFGVVALAVVVELGKDDIPDLNIAVAVAAHMAVRLAAAVLFAAVIVDLGAGAARTAAVLPEVILFAEAVDPVGGDADLLVPDPESLVVRRRGLVAGKNRGVETVGIQSHPFRGGQKLPGPVDGLALEVIAEGEVAQHLKIGTVTGSLADVLDIRRADALLAGGHAVTGRLLLAGEPGLHGAHARVDKQQRGIVLRDQGKAGQTQMALALKKGEVHLPQLVESKLFQIYNLQTF